MSFSSLISTAARFVSNNRELAEMGEERKTSALAHPYKAWVERKNERALAESDKQLANGGSGGIVYAYECAAHTKDIPSLQALLRHEKRVGSRSNGREIALLNVCYPPYHWEQTNLHMEIFNWKNNTGAIALLAPQCDLNATLGPLPLGRDNDQTILMLIAKNNPAAAEFIVARLRESLASGEPGLGATGNEKEAQPTQAARAPARRP